jgi:hypothetical protein
MKRNNILMPIVVLAMVMLLLTFHSISSIQPALADGAAGITTITFSANPAVLVPGDDVTITTTTTSAEHPEQVDAGKVTIQLATDGVGNPVPAASVVTWVSLNAPGQSPSGGITNLALDLDTLGFVPGTVGGFRAHYVTGGGAHRVETHFAAAVDLGTASSCSGLTIGATLASGDGCPLPGSSGPWTFRITLQNCTGMDLSAVKVQGGANGWAPLTGIATVGGGAVSVSKKQKNSVITWTVDIPDGATIYLDATVNGPIPHSAPAGQIRFLSGAWSAVYDHDGDALSPRVKTDYTGRVSITVGPCDP